MRRGFWFVAGAGAGIYTVVRGRRAVEALTADGLRDRARALALGARLFTEEVAAGQAEKETELRERLGLPPTGHPQLESGGFEPSSARTSTTENKEGTP